ncbi:MAG: glycosyltransferase [Parvularcula sp.]
MEMIFEEAEASVRILFLHNNFPAQFGTLGQYLSRCGWDVTFLTQRKGAKADGIDAVVYRDREQKDEHSVGHPFLKATGKAVVTGTSALEVGLHLKHKKGYTPDIIVAHSGWGPGMYMKDVWPDAAYAGYFEWYYKGNADDIVFMNEEPRPAMDHARERMRNAPIWADLVACDVGLCPTAYQASQFPDLFQPKLRVMHDGIDTAFYAPEDPGTVTFGEDTFSAEDEIVTYVARGMEPYRGFPEFMEALATVQKNRPNLRAIIVGEDRAAYGRKLKSGKTYKEDALERLDLDMSRITFTGLLSRSEYRDVLRLSSVHIYFTVPFVLSWSMMEAMSTGCLILASDTAPVREVMTHGENGLLTDFKDPDRVATDLEDTLSTRKDHAEKRAAARQTIVDGYSARDIFPAKKILFSSLVK